MMRWLRPAAGRGFARPSDPLAGTPRRVVLLEWEPNPSTDQLLRPWLASLGLETVVQPLSAPALDDGDLVVFVRYLTAEARRAVEVRRDRLAGVAYFMDDDLWDPSAWEGLPRDYRQRLRQRALAHREWISARADALWVPTAELARRYAAWQPRLVPLLPVAAPTGPAPVWAAYHGTASHAAELEWLRPVLAAALARAPALHVEVFGDRATARAFRALPRCVVLHPLPWPAYLAYTRATRRDIGLAPLGPGAFNAARGAVKFHDYARMGAFGLYAARAPYAGFVRDGVDGLLLPDDPAAWTEALVALAGDAPRRQALASAAVARAGGQDQPR